MDDEGCGRAEQGGHATATATAGCWREGEGLLGVMYDGAIRCVKGRRIWPAPRSAHARQ